MTQSVFCPNAWVSKAFVRECVVTRSAFDFPRNYALLMYARTKFREAHLVLVYLR